MTNRITAKKIQDITRSIREEPTASYGFNPMEYPFTVTATYYPGDIPEAHPMTEMHDRRAYSDAARDGWFEVHILDARLRCVPVARAAFTESKGVVIAERLAVDRPYRGFGFGRQMLDLGGRLWGGPVDGADAFQDEDEVFWNSPWIDEAAA